MSREIRNNLQPHDRFQFRCTGETLTKQSHREECDINKIMLKWQKTGIMEHRNNFEGKYGDFSETPGDYHESMNAVLEAQDMFLTLPSDVRAKFGNDPGAFLDFATDPKNGLEMVKLGLADKTPGYDPVIEPTKPLAPEKGPDKVAPTPK